MPISRDILRWGSNGDPVLSIFDVAKDPDMGGDPESLNALITGKHWMDRYFDDGNDTVDILANGVAYPDYLDPPGAHILGDPPSDGNADEDRDGTNVKPFALFHKISNPILGTLLGNHPETHPDDRWIIESAIKIIAAEDPDVFYILPALVDAVGHHAGGADRPEEWAVDIQPEVLWDDLNIFNLKANRDPVLDMVHEADVTFGMFLNTLQVRETYDNTILTFLSDHGLRVYMDEYLDTMQICLSGGFLKKLLKSSNVGAR